MLKEQFLPVLSSVCVAGVPGSPPGTEQQKIAWLKRRAACKPLLLPFLAVTTLFSSKTLILGILFSLMPQAGRGRRYGGGERQPEWPGFTVTLLRAELLIHPQWYLFRSGFDLPMGESFLQNGQVGTQ